MQKPISTGLLAALVLALGLPAVAQRYQITDLGTIQGSTYNWGTGVNNLGHVVGCAGCSGINTPGFFWSPQNGMQALPSLPSGGAAYANAINDSDQVAGWSYGVGRSEDDELAVIWTSPNTVQGLGTLPATGMQDLNLLIPAGSGWTLSQANGINDLGQITGQGTINLETHAYLLTPTK